MSVLSITYEDGTTKEINLDGVEKFMADLEANFDKGEFKLPDTWYDLIKDSDKDQLEHLCSQLMCMAVSKARLWHSSFSDEHIKNVKLFKDIQKIAKDHNIDLWPYLKP